MQINKIWLDNMTEIVRGDGMKYVLGYNEFHNLANIKVDGKTTNLIEYKYKNGNGRLKEIAYANGDTMKATYNQIGQMIGEKWYNSNSILIACYKYVYDNSGNIVRSIDVISKKEYSYTYEDGVLVRSLEYDIEIGTNENITSRNLVNTIRFDCRLRRPKYHILLVSTTKSGIFQYKIIWQASYCTNRHWCSNKFANRFNTYWFGKIIEEIRWIYV